MNGALWEVQIAELIFKPNIRKYVAFALYYIKIVIICKCSVACISFAIKLQFHFGSLVWFHMLPLIFIDDLALLRIETFFSFAVTSDFPRSSAKLSPSNAILVYFQSSEADSSVASYHITYRWKSYRQRFASCNIHKFFVPAIVALSITILAVNIHWGSLK